MVEAKKGYDKKVNDTVNIYVESKHVDDEFTKRVINQIKEYYLEDIIDNTENDKTLFCYDVTEYRLNKGITHENWMEGDFRGIKGYIGLVDYEIVIATEDLNLSKEMEIVIKQKE